VGIFKNIAKILGIGDSDSLPDINFENPVKVELHSHLIPAIDDGVQDDAQSIELLKIFSSYGYRKVITTPHIMSEFYNNSTELIKSKEEKINQLLKDNNIDIEFVAAGEYMVDDLLRQRIEKNDLLHFGKDRKYVLIELPFLSAPYNLKEITFSLGIAGYTPVLAHPERYSYFASQKGKYEEIYDGGLLFQVNQLSLIGYYSKHVQQAAEFLINNKMVDFVGSDTHHIKHANLQNEVFKSKLYQKACKLELLNNFL